MTLQYLQLVPAEYDHHIVPNSELYLHLCESLARGFGHSLW